MRFGVGHLAKCGETRGRHAHTPGSRIPMWSVEAQRGDGRYGESVETATLSHHRNKEQMGTSKLESSGDRFLSLCLQYALDQDWLSPTDLTEEFPAKKLMTALEAAPELRAKLLVEAAGVHQKIAPKKSTSAAAEDLQIALAEGICTAATILQIVSVDDHVRYLEKSALWDLLTRDQFWFQDGARPQARMLAMIKTGIDQDLIDFPRLVRAVTPEQLASDLPRELIEAAFCTAIHAGLDGVAFQPETLLEAIGLEAWIEHLPLAHFWDTVIKGELAASAGLGSGSPVTSTDPSDGDGAKRKAKRREGKDTVAASPPPPAPSSNDAELQARAQAIRNLEKIDRLPKDAATLSSPVLLGLEAMYEELLATETDEERADLIREAFPNTAMLDEALLALAETLDPRLTKESLKERGVDTSAIIQLVLFEERRRAAKSSRSPSPSPSPSSPPPAVKPPTIPPPPSAASGAVSGPVSHIPPLPPQARRVSTPPPPLPAQARKTR